MGRLPRIAITMGDPAGVGPELCLQLLTHPRVRAVCEPVIVGDLALLNRVARRLGWPVPDPEHIHDLANLDAEVIEPGKVSAVCGLAAFEYVTVAADEALAGRVDAIATGPLHKEALNLAGVPFPGHTEILAEQTGSPRVCMMLTSDEITCSLATVHVGYRDVADLLTRELVRETIEFTAAAMERLRGRKPRLWSAA